MQKVILIDRDGVINRYPGHTQYITKISDFEFLPGSKEALVKLHRSGLKIFVISNQAGVGKGLYSKETLDEMTRILTNEIESAGGHIEKVLYCTHTDEQNCECRKPKTGLLKEVFSQIYADISKTFFIGDSIRDIKTGLTFGCKTILVFSGKESRKDSATWEVQPDFVADNLLAATEIVLSQNQNKS